MDHSIAEVLSIKGQQDLSQRATFEPQVFSNISSNLSSSASKQRNFEAGAGPVLVMIVTAPKALCIRKELHRLYGNTFNKHEIECRNAWVVAFAVAVAVQAAQGMFAGSRDRTWCKLR